MSSYFKYVKEECCSDTADTIMVTVVMLWPLMFLLIGFSLDFSKNIVIRADLEGIALESVNAAIRAQDGRGNIMCKNTVWLNREAAIGMVNSTIKDAASTKLAIKSYLMKTGRAVSADFAGAADEDMRDSVYNGHTSEETMVASRADSQQVKTYRLIAKNFMGDSVNDDETPQTAFRIKVTCGNASNRQNKLSTGEQAGINGGNAQFRGVSNSRSDMITLDVKDWSGNFILSNPLAQTSGIENEVYSKGVNMDDEIGISNSSVNIQRYNINKTAISTWSQSAFNENGGDKK